MTDLERKVTRRSVNVVPCLRRRLVVALEPGDVISVREEGRRTWYRAPLGRVFTQICKWNADAIIAERKKQRMIKRMIKRG